MKQLILAIILLTPLATLASGKALCPSPSQLKLLALQGQLRPFYKVGSNCKKIKLNQLYLNNSSSPAEYQNDLDTIDKVNDWMFGPNGGMSPEGYAIKCDYITPGNGNEILISRFFSKKICRKN